MHGGDGEALHGGGGEHELLVVDGGGCDCALFSLKAGLHLVVI